jgi:hypothetical protein
MVEAALRKDPAIAPSPDKPAATDDVTVTLLKPVQAHGETLKELKFREPTGSDLMTIEKGWPVHIDWQSGQVTPNPAVMGQIMTVLAAVPPSTIAKLTGKDFTNCAHALAGFFVPDGQAIKS